MVTDCASRCIPAPAWLGHWRCAPPRMAGERGYDMVIERRTRVEGRLGALWACGGSRMKTGRSGPVPRRTAHAETGEIRRGYSTRGDHGRDPGSDEACERAPLLSGSEGRNTDILILGMAQTVTIQVRGRGTVTLPAALRTKYRLDEGQPLTLVDLDGAVLLSPRLLIVPRLVAEMERLRRARKLSLKDLGGPDRED